MIRHSLRHKLVVCLFAAMMLTSWKAHPQEAAQLPIRYQVTDLRTIAGCDCTYATAINDAGWVTGYAYVQASSGLSSRPFAWQKGMLTELPKLGGENGQALAINARGDLAGYATIAEAYIEEPVLWTWTSDRRFHSKRLSNLPGRATCLLDDGTAGGFVVRKQSKQAVMWKTGKMRTLGNPRDFESICNGINSLGNAVGYFIPEGYVAYSNLSKGDRHAVMWKEGRQIVLPKLGDALSECNAINEDGTAVGWSEDKIERNACVWKDGKIAVLPKMAGFRTNALAINRSGVIVGEALEAANKEGWKWLACLWHDGKLEDLNNLIPANSGWKLSVASHISDSGLIVGYGSYDKYPNDTWRAFLLTPIKQ